MRSGLIAAVIAVGVCSHAGATSNLSFEGQGHLLDLVVGDSSGPVIASLSMATPGHAQRVELPARHLRTEVFDTQRRVLLLRFDNPGDPALPASFSLMVRGDAGVLVLTDMFGGTPSNLGMTFLETNKVEVITGVNLPMLIKLASLKSSPDLRAVAREMREHGRNAIWVASDLLRGEKTNV